jgi:hypothetical protein
MASGNANTLTTWGNNWLRYTDKGEKEIKDDRTTEIRRQWSATMARTEWRGDVAATTTTTMMIHSNSRGMSYGVMNFILPPQRHFQTRALTLYRRTFVTTVIGSSYGPDMAPIQYVFCFVHLGKIFYPLGRRPAENILFSVPVFQFQCLCALVTT